MQSNTKADVRQSLYANSLILPETLAIQVHRFFSSRTYASKDEVIKAFPDISYEALAKKHYIVRTGTGQYRIHERILKAHAKYLYVADSFKIDFLNRKFYLFDEVTLSFGVKAAIKDKFIETCLEQYVIPDEIIVHENGCIEIAHCEWRFKNGRFIFDLARGLQLDEIEAIAKQAVGQGRVELAFYFMSLLKKTETINVLASFNHAYQKLCEYAESPGGLLNFSGSDVSLNEDYTDLGNTSCIKVYDGYRAIPETKTYALITQAGNYSREPIACIKEIGLNKIISIGFDKKIQSSPLVLIEELLSEVNIKQLPLEGSREFEFVASSSGSQDIEQLSLERHIKNKQFLASYLDFLRKTAGNFNRDDKAQLSHVTQLHLAEHTKASLSELDLITYSQFLVFQEIIKNPDVLVFSEGLSSLSFKYNLNLELVKNCQEAFKDGHNFIWEQYNAKQKFCLVKYTAPNVALALNIISCLYPTTDAKVEAVFIEWFHEALRREEQNFRAELVTKKRKLTNSPEEKRNIERITFDKVLKKHFAFITELRERMASRSLFEYMSKENKSGILVYGSGHKINFRWAEVLRIETATQAIYQEMLKNRINVGMSQYITTENSILGRELPHAANLNMSKTGSNAFYSNIIKWFTKTKLAIEVEIARQTGLSLQEFVNKMQSPRTFRELQYMFPSMEYSCVMDTKYWIRHMNILEIKSSSKHGNIYTLSQYALDCLEYKKTPQKNSELVANIVLKPKKFIQIAYITANVDSILRSTLVDLFRKNDAGLTLSDLRDELLKQEIIEEKHVISAIYKAIDTGYLIAVQGIGLPFDFIPGQRLPIQNTKIKINSLEEKSVASQKPHAPKRSLQNNADIFSDAYIDLLLDEQQAGKLDNYFIPKIYLNTEGVLAPESLDEISQRYPNEIYVEKVAKLDAKRDAYEQEFAKLEKAAWEEFKGLTYDSPSETVKVFREKFLYVMRYREVVETALYAYELDGINCGEQASCALIDELLSPKKRKVNQKVHLMHLYSGKADHTFIVVRSRTLQEMIANTKEAVFEILNNLDGTIVDYWNNPQAGGVRLPARTARKQFIIYGPEASRIFDRVRVEEYSIEGMHAQIRAWDVPSNIEQFLLKCAGPSLSEIKFKIERLQQETSLENTDVVPHQEKKSASVNHEAEFLEAKSKSIKVASATEISKKQAPQSFSSRRYDEYMKEVNTSTRAKAISFGIDERARLFEESVPYTRSTKANFKTYTETLFEREKTAMPGVKTEALKIAKRLEYPMRDAKRARLQTRLEQLVDFVTEHKKSGGRGSTNYKVLDNKVYPKTSTYKAPILPLPEGLNWGHAAKEVGRNLLPGVVGACAINLTEYVAQRLDLSKSEAALYKTEAALLSTGLSARLVGIVPQGRALYAAAVAGKEASQYFDTQISPLNSDAYNASMQAMSGGSSLVSSLIEAPFSGVVGAVKGAYGYAKGSTSQGLLGSMHDAIESEWQANTSRVAEDICKISHAAAQALSRQAFEPLDGWQSYGFADVELSRLHGISRKKQQGLFELAQKQTKPRINTKQESGSIYSEIEQKADIDVVSSGLRSNYVLPNKPKPSLFFSSAVAAELDVQEKTSMYGFNPKRTTELETEKLRLKAQYQPSNLTEQQTQEFSWGLDKYLYDPSSETAKQMSAVMKHMDAQKVPSKVATNMQVAQPPLYKVKPYRGEDLTKQFNQGTKPFVSSAISANVRAYFASNPEDADKLFKTYIPSIALENATTEEIAQYRQQFAEDVATVMSAQSQGVDASDAYVSNYIDYLINPEKGEVNEVKFRDALNQRIGASSEYDSLREKLKVAIDNKLKQERKQIVKDSAEVVQALSILICEGADPKTAACVNKAASGIMLMAPAAMAFAEGAVLTAGPVALACVGFVLIGHAIFGGSDDAPGANPVILMLEEQAQQIRELTRICIMMYKDVMLQLKFLNEKIDSYHLEYLKNFFMLFVNQDDNYLEAATYARDNFHVLKAQLDTLQKALPEIKDFCYAIDFEHLNQHTKVMSGLRSLHLEPARREVKKVEARLLTQDNTKRAISVDELTQLTETLQFEAVHETKEPIATGSNVSIDFLGGKIQEEHELVLQMLKVKTLEDGIGTAAFFINFLKEVVNSLEATKDGKDIPVLSNPVLLFDRGSVLLDLHKAYWLQIDRKPLPDSPIFELSLLINAIKEVLDFYNNIKLKELFDILCKQYVERQVSEFNLLVDNIQKDFVNSKVVSAKKFQAQYLQSDIEAVPYNEVRVPKFNIAEEWEYFYYHFGFDRYRNVWAYHEGPIIGRQYIYSDLERGGEIERRWRDRTGGLFQIDPMAFNKISCFLSALHSYPEYQHVNNVLSDEQCNGLYQDKWNSLSSNFIRFDEFIDELSIERKSKLSDTEFTDFLKTLNTFDKEQHLAEKRLSYALNQQHIRTELSKSKNVVDNSTREDQENFVAFTKVLPEQFGKAQLPLRLMVPQDTSKCTIKLLFNPNELDLPLSVRQLENMGVGRVCAEYNILTEKNITQREWPLQPTVTQNVRFFVNYYFKRYDDSYTKHHFAQAMVVKTMAGFYESEDDIVHRLYDNGLYSEGVTIDFSCKLVTNTRSVPKFETKHPSITEDLKSAFKITANLDDMVNLTCAEWQKEQARLIKDAFVQKDNPLRTRFKRAELGLATVRAFAYLVAPTQYKYLPEIFSTFTEEYFLNYIQGYLTDTSLDINKFYDDYTKSIASFRDKLNIFYSQLPRTLKDERLSSLLVSCQYYYNIAQSAKFMSQRALVQASHREIDDKIQYGICELNELVEARNVLLHRLIDSIDDMRSLVTTKFISQETYAELRTNLGVKESVCAMPIRPNLDLVELAIYNEDGLFPFLIQFANNEISRKTLLKNILEILREAEDYAIEVVNEVEENTGKTPLHVAAQLGDFEVFKLIHSFDARANIKDKNGNSCIELAAGTIVNDVKALIRTRDNWQAKAQDLDFSLNRTLWLIEQVIKCFEQFETLDLPVILLAGATRSGKSTLFNALLGILYEYVNARKVKALDSEISKTSNSSWSETLYPTAAITVDNQNYLLDLQGIDENRGIPETICQGVTMLLLKKYTKIVKSIVIVCDEHDLVHPFNNLRRVLERLGQNYQDISVEDISKNICFVVTKKSSNATQEDILVNLKDWLENDFKRVHSGNKAKLATKRLLQAIVASKDNIMFADVTNQESIKSFYAQINQKQAINTEKFDFVSAQRELKQFKVFLERLFITYRGLKEQLKSAQYGLSHKLYLRLQSENFVFPPSLEILKQEIQKLLTTAEYANNDALIEIMQNIDFEENSTYMLNEFKQKLMTILKKSPANAHMMLNCDTVIEQVLTNTYADITVNKFFFKELTDLLRVLLLETDFVEHDEDDNNITFNRVAQAHKVFSPHIAGSMFKVNSPHASMIISENIIKMPADGNCFFML